MYYTGIQIPYQTCIAEGLKFGHWGTIVINPNAKIGKNFSISHGCCVGNAAGKHAGVPIIGDNVIIFAGAKVIGKIYVGDNVVIGANAVVTKDVPSNCIVAGVPAKVISKNVEAAVSEEWNEFFYGYK